MISPLILKRTGQKGKAVTGTLVIPIDNDKLLVATLENADFLIPAGTYPLKLTWSPKFKKQLPEICDVPERAGIRIHMGTIPEHSTGCVLVSAFAMNYVNYIINKFNRLNDDEELQIQIC